MFQIVLLFNFTSWVLISDHEFLGSMMSKIKCGARVFRVAAWVKMVFVSRVRIFRVFVVTVISGESAWGD
jgi:hypothetical protein